MIDKLKKIKLSRMGGIVSGNLLTTITYSTKKYESDRYIFYGYNYINNIGSKSSKTFYVFFIDKLNNVVIFDTTIWFSDDYVSYMDRKIKLENTLFSLFNTNYHCEYNNDINIKDELRKEKFRSFINKILININRIKKTKVIKILMS